MFPLEMNDVGLIRETAKESRSRICGFIMYTKADAFVAKVLKDDDYWDSLDAISGPNWPIFAVRPLCSRRKIFSCAGRKNERIAHFVPSIGKETEENLKYLQFFNLDSLEQLPCFIAFYVTDKNEVEQLVRKIKGNSVYEVYASIREIVEAVSDAEKHILPEYKSTENVFREVSKNLNALCFRRSMADGLPAVLMFVKPILRLLKSF